MLPSLGKKPDSSVNNARMNTRQYSKSKNKITEKICKSNNSSYIHIQVDDTGEDDTVTQEQVLLDVRNKLASEQTKNKELNEVIAHLRDKILDNKGKTIDHLKEVIGKLKCKSVVLERGIQTVMATKTAHTQTQRPTTEIESMCILRKENSHPEQESFGKQQNPIPAESLLQTTDTSGNHQVEIIIDDVMRVNPPFGPSATISPVAGKGRRIPSSHRKILIYGDEYAKNFRKVLELYMDKSIFSVESFVRPNIEFNLAAQDIFKNTITYGENDFVICMVSTQNISNSVSLNTALNRILPIGRTKTLFFYSNYVLTQIIYLSKR
nr:unnamed protein product [Callosobruchus analis]